MSSLFERAVNSADQSLVILAPPQAEIPSFYRNVPTATSMHATLLEELQRLRGTVYLEDGAIKPEQLSADGCHRTPEDQRAWHLLVLAEGQVRACGWYLEHQHARSIQDLRVRSCPLVKSGDWKHTVDRAIDSELRRARRLKVKYAELGGWAVATEFRRTGASLLLALAAYGLSRTLGGALGLTTATARHASATILRKLGGASLEANGIAVPPYYDPRYECEMELLRFDSRRPNPRYEPAISALMDRMISVPVLGCHPELVAVTTREESATWRPVAATGGAAA